MLNSLEFYKTHHGIFVDFNDTKNIPFKTFLTLPKAQNFIKKMYIEIITKYKKEIKEEVDDTNNIGLVVGTFINKHFLEKDKTYDVVILGGSESGEVIKFNLEDDTE